MASNLRLSSVIPAGLIVGSIAESEEAIVVSARAGAGMRPPAVRQRVRLGS
jgi:hypothetical protein